MERIVQPDTDRDVASGSDGELLIRGPQGMLGYGDGRNWRVEPLAADGWLCTGNVARADSTGNVYIVDPLTDVFKVQGRQVAPAEIEQVLQAHPAVRRAAVVGIPTGSGDEVPAAYVVLKPGRAVSSGKLMGLVAVQLAPHPQLGRVEFVAELPIGPSGKVLGRELARRAHSAAV